MLLQKRERATKGVSCQGQNCFPLAVHLGGYRRYWGKFNISRNATLLQLCGRRPQRDRQGKSFTKPFNLTLAVVFLTSTFYLLSHVRKLEISKKVVLLLEAPPKSFRGDFQISSLRSHFANFLKSILNVTS